MTRATKTSTISNLHWRLTRLLLDGRKFTAGDIATEIGVSPKRAKDTLTKMHRAGIVYVSAWAPGGLPVAPSTKGIPFEPEYALSPASGPGRDVADPNARPEKTAESLPKYGFWGI